MDSAFSEKWYEMKMIRWKLKAILNIQILSTKKNWRTRIWLQKKISSIFHGTEISISSSTLNKLNFFQNFPIQTWPNHKLQSQSKEIIHQSSSIIHPIHHYRHHQSSSTSICILFLHSVSVSNQPKLKI